MKRIDVIFEDREYKTIRKVKDLHDSNWHDFILWLVENSKGGK